MRSWINTQATRIEWQLVHSVLQCVAVCCSVLQYVAVCEVLQSVTRIEWRRPIECLIFWGHFPQKSHIISGSFAEKTCNLRHPDNILNHSTRWITIHAQLIHVSIFLWICRAFSKWDMTHSYVSWMSIFECTINVYFMIHTQEWMCTLQCILNWSI